MICGVKFGRFFNFDLWRPSWILENVKNSCTRLLIGSNSMSVPNFVKIRWTGRLWWAKMWFVGSNLVDFWTLTFGGHLEFYKMSKTLTLDYYKGQLVCPCQILCKSDEREGFAEPKCDLWGQIWSIFELWPLATIFDFAINEKFLHKLVFKVN